MITLKQAVIVEGKYDKIRLKGFIDAPIIETNGFRIFKDKEKQQLIRKIAMVRGVVIMTDSDSGGFVIRNFLKGIVPNDRIINCYVPQILGKEKRKTQTSKEGFVGVEGMEEQIILNALKNCKATLINEATSAKDNKEITKQDLYEFGFTGRDKSAVLRTKLLQKIGLPTYLTTNSLISALNCIYTREEIFKIFTEIIQDFT